MAGLDGAVKYLNPAWADMHGYAVEELEDADIRVFHTEEQWTDELRMENQLRQFHKMKVVGQLAGGVAHDLDNMLSPILGYAELLLADMFPVDPKYEDLMQIKAAAPRWSPATERCSGGPSGKISAYRSAGLSAAARSGLMWDRSARYS